MIHDIDDMIKELLRIKNEHGNILIRTQIQIGAIVEVLLEPVALNIGAHETDIKMLLIKGYKEK